MYIENRRGEIHDRTFRMYRLQPNLTWERNLVTTNSFGIIGEERTLAKPPRSRRIALLGSSLSAGYLVPAAETYPARLEKRLNAVHPNGPDERFEVLNFSCPGYALSQVLDVALEDTPRFSPDVYVVGLDELELFGSWSWHLVALIRAGIDAKYDFLRATLRQAGISQQDDVLELFGKLAPYRVPVVREILLRLKANAARHHAGIMAVLLPTAEAGGLSRNRVAWTHGLLRDLDIPVVDVLDSFDGFLNRRPLRVSLQDPHPNGWGNALIFENLYSKLRAQPAAWTALVGSPPPDQSDAVR
jgi:hypothetical protein